ncbi:M23 family metallopeptidase [Porphyromonas pogonae]|uniref:M23 family metallopeptidase n=1 Tax=Porphyromonas pogonae TaxID=867595 RepID=UPI002E769EAA|nr:M23 family metallopeptidase [Porphyromonas pogonae]
MIRQRKTSVLIVSTDGKTSKVRQIPTHLLLHWWKYTVLSLLVIGVLLSLSGLLIYRNTSELYKKKLARAEYIRRQIDVNKARQTFLTIESGIDRFNHFLEERGLDKMKMENTENMGGPSEFDVTEINEIADHYEKRLSDLKNTVEAVPLGRPADGAISSRFGYRRNPFSGRGSEKHMGLDFRGSVGDTVKTTADGIVIFAGRKGGYGNCVVVRHCHGLSTLYGHLSRVKVNVGDSVKTGELVGLLGSSGRSTGPHLHYEIIKGTERINPETYVTIKDM